MELFDSIDYSTKNRTAERGTVVRSNAGRDFGITLALPAETLEGDAE